MATDHDFKVKNGLTVQGETLVVNHTEALSDTQVYIKRKDSSTNLMRWGEGTSGGSTYRWRIDQSYDFIANNAGADHIVLKASDGSIQGASYKLGSTQIIDSSRNLVNIGTISSGAITSSGNISGAALIIDSATAVDKTSHYMVFYDGSGGPALYAGNTSDNRNYYQSDNHRFRSNDAGTNFAEIGSLGMIVGDLGPEANMGKLHVKGSDSGATPYQSGNDGITIERNGRAALNFLTPNTQDAYVFWGDPETANAAYIGYNHSSDQALWKTGGTFRLQGGRVEIDEQLRVNHSSTVLDISGDSSTNTYFASTGEFRIRPNGTTINKIVLNASYINAPAYQVGGTEVIDSSRNLTNIGTITTANTVSIANSSSDSILLLGHGVTNTLDALIQFSGSAANMATEGAELWYDNSVGDFHIATTYDNAGAAIRFHTRTAASKSTSNERLVISGDGDFDFKGGDFSNVGTITSGNISVGNITTSSGGVYSNSVFQFLTTSSAAQDIRTKSVFAGTSYGDTPPAGSFNATNTYELNGTTVIDSSRNLTNIGSGTFSGTLATQGNVDIRRNNNGDGQIIKDINWLNSFAQGSDDRIALIRANNQGGGADTRGGSLTFFTRQPNSANFNSFSLDNTGTVNVTNLNASSNIKINGTTVIDSSRNISSGNITVPNSGYLYFGDTNHYIQGGASLTGGDIKIRSSDDLNLYSRWVRYFDDVGSAGEYARISYNGSWINSPLSVNGNIKIGASGGGTTVIDANRVVQNVTLGHSNTGARFETNDWMYDTGGKARFYFEGGGRTFFGSDNGYVYRDNSDTGRATISNYGGINLLSGGDGQVGSTVALAVGGTTTIDSSRNIIASSFRPGADNGWKIRPNNGNTQLAFEYSTSTALADTNIKAELRNDGDFIIGDRIANKIGGYSIELKKASTSIGDGGGAGALNLRATGNFYLRHNGYDALTFDGTRVYFDDLITVRGGSADWSESIQGASRGSIHLDPETATNNFGNAITFGASDSGSGNTAHAGIYVRSDGAYGTKMYLSTTDSYAQAAKTSIKIDHSGHTSIVRGNLYVNPGIVYTSNGNAANPSFSFANDGNTGLYSVAADNIGFATGGTARAFISSTQFNMTGAGVFSGSLRADGGNLIMGDEAYSASSSYVGIKTSLQSGSNDYMIISGTTDGSTYVSAKSNESVFIRGGGNASNNQIQVSGSSLITATTSNFYCTGNITAYYSSDKSLKENIRVIDNPIEKIKQIRGVYFDWTEDYIKEQSGDGQIHVRKDDVGVIAQEVQPVLDEVITTRDDGTLAVRYEKMVALCIEAIKEQQEKIEKLEELVEKLISEK